jgi:hypothetical protein
VVTSHLLMNGLKKFQTTNTSVLPAKTTKNLKPKTTNMKKKIQQTTEVEVDIQLPYYFKNEINAYVICTEQSAIVVCYGVEKHEHISNLSNMMDYILDASTNENSIEITKDEFKKIYGKVALTLNSII